MEHKEMKFNILNVVDYINNTNFIAQILLALKAHIFT